MGDSYKLLTTFAQNVFKYDLRGCANNPLQRLIKLYAKMKKCDLAISFTLTLLQTLFFVCDNLSDSLYRQLRSVIQKLYFEEANLNLGRIFSLTISVVTGVIVHDAIDKINRNRTHAWYKIPSNICI